MDHTQYIRKKLYTYAVHMVAENGIEKDQKISLELTDGSICEAEILVCPAEQVKYALMYDHDAEDIVFLP